MAKSASQKTAVGPATVLGLGSLLHKEAIEGEE